MRVAILLAMLMFVGAAHAANLPVLDPSDGTIFPAEHARELLRQCSRATPQNVDGTWLPSQTQIRELEARLPMAAIQFMEKEGWAKKYQEHFASTRYDHQYGGLLVHGRKIIYVNAFPHQVVDFDGSDLAKGWKTKTDWRHDPVLVCDGGEDFWGGEYDPAAKTFENFEFNGAI